MPHAALGYSRRNIGRLLACLTDLNLYLSPNWYPVGGVCIRWYLVRSNYNLPKRPFNGVDVVAVSLDTYVTEKFLIAHNHPQDGYWALIHLATGTKVNVFWPEHSSPLYDAMLVPDFPVRFQSAADQLVTVVDNIRKPLHGRPLDPKQLEDAWRLYRLVGPKDSEKTWQERYPNEPDFKQAFDEAQEACALRPELIRPGLYTNLRHLARQALVCSECRHIAEYPLASKMRIARAYRR